MVVTIERDEVFVVMVVTVERDGVLVVVVVTIEKGLRVDLMFG